MSDKQPAKWAQRAAGRYYHSEKCSDTILARIIEAESPVGELVAALEALYADSKEFHDTEFDPKDGSHTNCGWCMAEAALRKARE